MSAEIEEEYAKIYLYVKNEGSSRFNKIYTGFC